MLADTDIGFPGWICSDWKCISSKSKVAITSASFLVWIACDGRTEDIAKEMSIVSAFCPDRRACIPYHNDGNKYRRIVNGIVHLHYRNVETDNIRPQHPMYALVTLSRHGTTLPGFKS